jgi:hypothetical protein
MFTRFRRTVAASAAVIALGAGGAAWAASAASAAAAPTAVSRCTYNDLAVWVNADAADTTAGTVTYPLELTNVGRGTCALEGFPGVQASTLGRVRLGAPAARLYGVPATVVDLPPGATAHATIQYIGSRVVPGCKPDKAGFLAVYAPDATVAKRAFFPLPVCTTGRVDLTVRRVKAGF